MCAICEQYAGNQKSMTVTSTAYTIILSGITVLVIKSSLINIIYVYRI